MNPKETPASMRFIALLLPKLIQILLLMVISIISLPFFWLGWLIWYRPPNVVYNSQVLRYFRLVWTVNPPAPGLPTYKRIWLTLSILQKWLMSPIVGNFWLLDEILYGRKMDQVPMDDPLLVISAGRSGSTQITRYLEEDPNLAAPNLLMSMFPYLWLWKLAPATIGRVLTKDKVRAKLEEMMPPELLERHEADPFKADTFDGAFFNFHLNPMAWNMGPEAGIVEFSFAEFAPHDRKSIEEDFVQLVDKIGRKTLVYNGPGEEGEYPRFLLKGHFLLAAPALSRHFPNGNFLTVVREPLSRLQSGINYLRVNPSDPVLGPTPWEFLTLILSETESRYCEVEQAWFGDQETTNRCVIRFTEFVDDLPGAMGKVYKDCCGKDELPPHVPENHPPRERKNYTVDRSLEDLSVDQEAIRARLADYIEWVS